MHLIRWKKYQSFDQCLCFSQDLSITSVFNNRNAALSYLKVSSLKKLNETSKEFGLNRTCLREAVLLCQFMFVLEEPILRNRSYEQKDTAQLSPKVNT